MISDVRLKELCELYYDDVYRYCISYVRDAEDAKDITQETYAFFIKKSPTLQDDNIKAWLYSVARIKIKQYNKMKQSKPQNISCDDLESLLMLEHGQFYTIEEALSQYLYNEQEIEEAKQKILCQLTPKERELYDEAYVKRKKYAEIAPQIGVSPATINVKTFRLRNKIKAIVKNIFDFCLIFLI